MTLKSEDIRCLCEEFSLLHEGMLDAKRSARLAERLRSDGDARRLYIRFMRICAGLQWDLGEIPVEAALWMSDSAAEEARADDLTATAALDIAGPLHNAAAEAERAKADMLPARSPRLSPLLGFLGNLPAAIHPVHHPVWFVAAAATLTSLFWLVVMLTLLPRQQHDSGQQQASGETTAIPFFAKVVHLQDATCALDAPPLRLGADLPLGQRWDLHQGRVQLLFGNGAVVVLEGPTQFEITSAGTMQLERGRLLARAEGRARGFTLHTPMVEVVDLGTEFGVNVQEQETEVHVFTGSVQVASTADLQQDQFVLQAGDASLFGNSPQLGFYVQEMKMNRAVFMSLAVMLAVPSVTTTQAATMRLDLDVNVTADVNDPDTQSGFISMTRNATSSTFSQSNTFNDVFGPGLDVGVSFTGTTRSIINTTVLTGANAGLANLLRDAWGRHDSGAIAVNLMLPVGDYNLTTYHHFGASSPVSDILANLTITDAEGVTLHTGLQRTLGANVDTIGTFTTSFTSNGVNPVTLQFQRTEGGQAFLLNGFDLELVEENEAPAGGAIPEPASGAALGLSGLIMLGYVRMRRRTAS